MNFNLIVSPLNEEPIQYELNAKRIGIGRAADNQIVLDYDTVSSSHCEIRQDDERGWVVEDIGSKNGTRVNGRAVLEPRQLSDGDRLLIGETVPCHFIELAEGADYEQAVKEGDDQESAAEYVTLNDKLQELEKDILSKTLEAETLEGHLTSLREQFESKKKEYDELYDSIKKLQKDIESSSNEDEIDKLQQDLMEKTQRITLLKSDIAGTEAQIDDLEKTKKTTAKAEPEAKPLPAAKPVPDAKPAPPKPTVAAPAPPKPAAPVTPAPPAAPAAPAAPKVGAPVAAKTVPMVKPKAPPSVSGAPGPKKPGKLPVTVAAPAKPEDL